MSDRRLRPGATAAVIMLALFGSYLIPVEAVAAPPNPQASPPTTAAKVVAQAKKSPPTRAKPADRTLRAVKPRLGRNTTSTPAALSRAAGSADHRPPATLSSRSTGLSVTAAATQATNAFSSITISPDLNCTAESAAFPAHPSQFYGGDACATFLWVDGAAYGPDSIPAGPSVEPWTPISQSVTGTGSANDPIRSVTVVAAGDTDVRLTQTDTLVVGSAFWKTDVTIDNPGGHHVTRVTTARDCYVAESDIGLGQATTANGISFCEGDSAALALVPKTTGSTFYENQYGAVWSAATRDADLPNSYEAAAVDNGQALSWALPAASSVSRSWQSVMIAGPTASEAGGAPNPAVPPTTCSSGRPVNCATGDFWHTFTDVSIPARGLPLTLTRTYDLINSAVDGPFGYGWSSSWGLRLVRSSSTSMDVVQENGSVVTFTSADGEWSPPSYVNSRLDSDGSDWVLTRPELGLSYVFGADLLLREIRNVAGEKLQVARDGSGRIASVAQDGHGTIALDWVGDHIVRATDPTGAVTSYDYDAAGNLVDVTVPTSGVWRFSYDDAHHLVSMADPLGHTTTNTFDSSFRVTSQTQPSGKIVSFSYAGDPASASGGITTMSDERGVETTYRFANMLLLSRERDGGGVQRQTDYGYDLVTLRLSRVTDDGISRSMAYDVQGRLIASTDARGYTTSYSYDGDSFRVSSATTPEGRVSPAQYDTRGRLTRTDDGRTVRTYAYGDADHPSDLTSVGEGDRTATFSYDALGDVKLAVVAGPSGSVVQRAAAYDDSGRTVCSVLPTAYAAGTRCIGSHLPGTTWTEFDDAGNSVKVIGPTGGITTDQYDLGGRLTATVDPAGARSSFGYDNSDRIRTLTRGAGTSMPSTTTTTYDIAAGTSGCPSGFGTVTCTKVSDGGKTTITGYDASDDVVSMVGPGGATEGMDRRGGLVRTATRADGSTVDYSYSGDLLSDLHYSDGTAVYFGYDADGLRTYMANDIGSTIWEYDQTGTLTAETGPNGTVRGGRDGHGDLVTISYPDGSTVHRSYDAAGRARSVTDWSNRTTTFDLDDNGAVEQTDLPNGRAIHAEHDDGGALTGVAVPGTGTLDYRRDSSGRVSREQASRSSGGTSAIGYDPLGKLAKINDEATSSDASNNPITVSGVSQTFDDALACQSGPAGGPAELRQRSKRRASLRSQR